ncbi:WD repeat-containing protein 74 [Belonocnema kinseyi]|uniref:WD repeat-containing protein 74 n=1 Tax=Belonocnema kinseyi TaxID=2817044 RepID=UPI00143D6EE6|nr:WD repeat-containing protein 74 [Belonocnema kinseyi]
MAQEDYFNVFVGGISTSLKGISLDGTFQVTNSQKFPIPSNRNITALSWGNDKETEILVGCGTKESASVEIFNTELSSFARSFQCTEGEGIIIGVCRHNNTLLAARKSGHVIYQRPDEDDGVAINAGPNLHRMRQSTSKKEIIATGGLENPLQLFDLEKKKQIFVAKNVKNDSLELRVPVWISDIGFFPDSSKLVTSSKYGHVRLYDHHAQRRPVMNIEVKQEALGYLAVDAANMQVIVGSGKGRMHLIDLRNGKIVNHYKGAVGSVTAIAINKKSTNVVSVSLDRYIRIHDIKTKELLKKEYLTSRPTCLLIRSEWTER